MLANRRWLGCYRSLSVRHQGNSRFLVVLCVKLFLLVVFVVLTGVMTVIALECNGHIRD